MDATAIASILLVFGVGLLCGSFVGAATVRAALRSRLRAATDSVAVAQAHAATTIAEAARAGAAEQAAVARAHVAEVDRASAEGQRDTAVAQARRAEDTARAGGALTAALGPLAERLELIGRQVGQLETDRSAHLGQLSEQIRSVVSMSEGLQAQTSSLAGALRSSNSRGTWGEVQLQRVVEAAGMLPYVDFDTQTTMTSVDGGRIRPDMTVRLPGGRGLALDAKAPLALIDPDATAHDPAAQAMDQARKLRGHVTTLASKQYWAALPSSPEFVICFVPTESILSTALHADPTLLDYAMTHHVVLASPLTLLVLLKTVAMTWREQAVHENAEQMLTLGRELYQRMGKVAEHADGVGKALETVFTRYNTFVGSFEQRLLVTARRMTDLGLSGEVSGPRAVETPVKSFSAVELVTERDAAWGDDLDDTLDSLIEVAPSGLRPAHPGERRVS